MATLPKRNPARRNVSSTRATLAPQTGELEIPELPLPTDDHVWHPLTLAWWAAVWSSPMAPEYDDSDIHGLYVLAMLVDGFWTHPHWTAAAEIRLQGQRFGLSPIDRRRLQWEIERTDEAQERGNRRRSAGKPTTKTQEPEDRYGALKAV